MACTTTSILGSVPRSPAMGASPVTSVSMPAAPGKCTRLRCCAMTRQPATAKALAHAAPKPSAGTEHKHMGSGSHGVQSRVDEVTLIVKNMASIHNCLTSHTRISKMNSQFDWTLVRSFLAALEQGSLLGASRTIGSSQPTVGRHISELESQLGVVLFERTGRGLLPTDMAIQTGRLGAFDGSRRTAASAQRLRR